MVLLHSSYVAEWRLLLRSLLLRSSKGWSQRRKGQSNVKVNWNSGLPSYNSPWYPGQAIWCIGWRVILLDITLTLPHIIIQRTAEAPPELAKDGRSKLKKSILLRFVNKVTEFMEPRRRRRRHGHKPELCTRTIEALGWDRTMWVLGSKLSRQTDILSQYLRGNRLRCAISWNGHVYYVVGGIPFCGGGLQMVIEF